MKVKVKIFRLPNEADNDGDGIEEEIEDEIKKRANDGFTFDKMIGDAAMVMLVFTKDE